MICSKRLLLLVMVTLSGCGEPVTPDATDTSASEKARQLDGCGAETDDPFSLRIVYDVYNSYEQEALRAKGAPGHVKDITRRELLMRGNIVHRRATGKTWMRDPDKDNAWQQEYDDAMDRLTSNAAILQWSAAWKVRGQQIPEIVVDIDWVERREPGGYSFRYGGVPGAPNQGERWYDEPLPRPTADQAEAALVPALSGAADAVMAGREVSQAQIAGVECEMLRKRNGENVHELCIAEFDGRTVPLHTRDLSPDGEVSEIAVEIQRGVCISDDQLAAPSRVDFDADY